MYNTGFAKCADKVILIIFKVVTRKNKITALPAPMFRKVYIWNYITVIVCKACSISCYGYNPGFPFSSLFHSMFWKLYIWNCNYCYNNCVRNLFCPSCLTAIILDFPSVPSRSHGSERSREDREHQRPHTIPAGHRADLWEPAARGANLWEWAQ